MTDDKVKALQTFNKLLNEWYDFELTGVAPDPDWKAKSIKDYNTIFQMKLQVEAEMAGDSPPVIMQEPTEEDWDKLMKELREEEGNNVISIKSKD